MAELEAVGVELGDWSEGIVDFSSVVAGRQVWLCWRQGEQAVTHWHEFDEGFPERRSIEQLESWELLAPVRG